MKTLREPSPPRINYFADMPAEIICHILTDCKFGNSAPHYLIRIENVCKAWKALMPDITCILLNRGQIRLKHIPHIHKLKEHSYDQAKSIHKYMKQLGSKLTYLDLTDLRGFDYKMLNQLKSEHIETVTRQQCSFRDNNILPKFTQVKQLTIAPNHNTDLSFIPKLANLKLLTLHFITRTLFNTSLPTVAKCSSISTLGLSAASSIYPDFTEEFRMPDQVKEVSLRGIQFSSHVFNDTSEVEWVDLKNIYLAKPITFANLSNLKRLSIGIRENIAGLTITSLSVKQLKLSSISLQNLTLTNCNIQDFKYNLPLIESIVYDRTSA